MNGQDRILDNHRDPQQANPPHLTGNMYGQTDDSDFSNDGQNYYGAPPLPNTAIGHQQQSNTFAQNVPYAAIPTSSTSPASLGMSVSPPHWIPGNAPWGTQSGNFAGSVGALGTSFGRERDRELEARYVKDFACCGKQLNGLHELLEHYEEEHANLGPNARIAAVNAAQVPMNNGVQSMDGGQNAMVGGMQAGISPAQFQSSTQHGEVPTPPGMMDIEMDGPTNPAFIHHPHPAVGAAKQNFGVSLSAPASPWAGAFRPQRSNTPPNCLPPSLLSFASSQSTPRGSPTPEQQLKAMKKAQKKAERAAFRDDPSASDAEGEKKFPCPVEGCGKVYKQANGLKYHLTRSVNGHGHVNLAAIGGVSPFVNDK